MNARRWIGLVGGLLALLTATVCSAAGEFGVSPLRVDLDNDSRSGVLTVSNEGKEPLRIVVKLMKWSQSASGDESYTESDALLFFPRSMTIAPMDSRVVRIGLKAPITGQQPERAFRLYIEDAAPDDPDAKKNQVQFRFRFGIPIFVAPTERRVSIALGSATVENGRLVAVVDNTGSETVRFDTFRVSAEPSWEENASGLYHHPATQRRYELRIPAAVCRAGGILRLLLKGEKAKLEREITLAADNCVQGK